MHQSVLLLPHQSSTSKELGTPSVIDIRLMKVPPPNVYVTGLIMSKATVTVLGIQVQEEYHFI